MQIRITEFQQTLHQAFVQGLQLKFGETCGSILGDVIAFYQGVRLEPRALQQILDDGAPPILNAILSGKVDGTVLRGVRLQTIGCALLDNRDAVVRWATAGLNRCRQVGGDWPATYPQWQWILEDPGRLILYARQTKYYLNQIETGHG